MSKSRKAKSLALLLALAFVFTSLFSSIGAVAFAAEDGTRLYGGVREATAVEISKEGWEESDDVVLVNGYAYPDALAAGPLAQKLDAPILLTDKDVLPDVTKAEIDRLGAETVYIVGGTGVVSDAVAEATGKTIVRLGEKDRYETAVAVAEKLKELGVSTEKVVIARGDDYPDALAAAAVKPAMPILFAGKAEYTSLVDVTEDALADLGVEDVVIVGGTGVVSAEIEEQIDAIVGDVTRIGEGTRIETAVAIANAFKPADGYKGVVLATGYNYADALAGGPYAAKNGYALLLTDKAGNLTSASVDFIKANTSIKADAIVALGGPTIVSEAALTAAKDAATPVALQVESVSAINLKSVKVTFNKALNPDALGTIQIKDANNNAVTLDATQGIKLSADGKVLSITASGSFNQGAEYSLKIEGVKTADGKEETTYDGKFTALDTTVPVVESAIITSPKTIEIAFSEPVTSSLFASGIDAFAGVLTNLVQIDGVNAYVDDISLDYATNKMQLKLNTALTAGEHTVKVMGFKDYAGFPVEAKEFKSSLAADTTAPSVTAVQVLQYDKIRVTFDEVISTPVAANFAVSVGGTNHSVTQVDAVAGDQKSYDLTVSPELGLGAVVDATLKYKNIKDFYNNEVTTEKTFSFKASDETTAPTVISNTLNNDNTVELTFSEDVEGLQVTDFELLDKDNKVVTGGVTNVQPKTINNVVSKKVYTVTLVSSVNAGSNYTLKLKKDSVNDFSIRKNTNAEQTFALSTKDLVRPNVSAVLQTLEVGTTTINTDADVLDTKLVIYFNEAMDKATLENKANYLINNEPIGSNVTVTPAQDGKSVTLVINRTSPDGQLNFVAPGTATLKVLNLKDVAGNLVNDFNVNLTVQTYALTAKIISDVELVAKNRIKIVPNSGQVISAVDLNEIQVIDSDSQTVYAQATRVISYDSTDGSVTIELSRNLGSDTLAVTAVGTDIAIGDPLEVKVTGDGVTNAQGQTQTLTDGAYIVGSITDKVKPSFVATDTDNDGLIDVDDASNTITLTFDENVYAPNSADLEAALVIKNKDGNRLGTTAYNVVVDIATGDPNSNTVVIALLPGVNEYVGQYTITLSDNVALMDIAGNLANDIATVTTESLTVESQSQVDAVNVAAAKAALTLTVTDPTAATSTITLPASQGAATVTWAITPTDAGSITSGVYTTPARTGSEQTVVLTATITSGTATDTQAFTVTVPSNADIDGATEGTQYAAVTVAKN